jgi:hypothetical protein
MNLLRAHFEGAGIHTKKLAIKRIIDIQCYTNFVNATFLLLLKRNNFLKPPHNTNTNHTCIIPGKCIAPTHSPSALQNLQQQNAYSTNID